MGRLKRVVYRSLVVLSALLAVLGVALWVMSFHYHFRGLHQDHSKTSYHLECREGRLWTTIQYSAFYPDNGGNVVLKSAPIRQPMLFDSETFLQRQGFNLKKKAEDSTKPPPVGWQSPRWIAALGMNRDKPVSLFSAAIPVWFFVLLTSILPAQMLVRVVRSRWRKQPGQCPSCGYDLRATSGRCPECGTEPPPNVGGGGGRVEKGPAKKQNSPLSHWSRMDVRVPVVVVRAQL